MPGLVHTKGIRIGVYLFMSRFIRLVSLILLSTAPFTPAGKSIVECRRLLQASGSPKVRLELISPERQETSTVAVTRGKFVTLN